MLGERGQGAAQRPQCRTLAVRCGAGADLLDLGATAPSRNVLSVGLASGRAQPAKQRRKGLDIGRGSTTTPPFAACTFDLVSQFTALSSVPKKGLRRAAEAERLRVLKPGGLVV